MSCISTGKLNNAQMHSTAETSALRCLLSQDVQRKTTLEKNCTTAKLASCLIYAQPFWHTALPQTTTPWLVAQAMTWQMTDRCLCPFRWQPMPISLLVWVRSFIEPDLFDNNVPIDNTTPIYLINLLWKLGLA